MKKLKDLAVVLSCMGEEAFPKIRGQLAQDDKVEVLAAGDRIYLVWQGEKLLQEEFGSYELGAPRPRKEIPTADSLAKLWQKLLRERLNKVI